MWRDGQASERGAAVLSSDSRCGPWSRPGPISLGRRLGVQRIALPSRIFRRRRYGNGTHAHAHTTRSFEAQTPRNASRHRFGKRLSDLSTRRIPRYPRNRQIPRCALRGICPGCGRLHAVPVWAKHEVVLSQGQISFNWDRGESVVGRGLPAMLSRNLLRHRRPDLVECWVT